MAVAAGADAGGDDGDVWHVSEDLGDRDQGTGGQDVGIRIQE